MYENSGPRPAIATIFGITSLIWGIVMLGWVLVVIALAAVIGFGGWLFGPITGLAGTAIGSIIALYCLLSSSMSFMLLWAGWLILRGDPGGIKLLRLWAWISLIFDALTLLFSGGTAPTSWGALIYAFAVLYFTRPDEIDHRWTTDNGPSPCVGKPKFTTDPDF